MKVVYVYPQFAHLAGTERVLIDKMNYLANRDGVKVFMVTYEQGVHPIAYPLSPLVKHIDLDVRFCTLYQKPFIVRYFKRYIYRKLLQYRFNQLMAGIQPDIVIAVTYYSTILSMVANCPIHFIRILESHIEKKYIHSNDPLNHKSLRKRIRSLLDMRILNKATSQFDLLVALNQEDATAWFKYSRTRVIPNIVHLNKTGRYSNLENKRVIFVGRYTIQKGIPDLFRIWQIVKKKHPDWHLDLYGDGENKEIPYTGEEWEKMNVHVHRPCSDIFSCYLESSIFVLTSIYEPFGLVMPEAMSCGLPVVAFDCPSGPASIITDSVDGFLIKDRNINAFADRLCQLIETPQLRKTMGIAAIQSSQRYSAERIMPQWIDLFNELITAHK